MSMTMQFYALIQDNLDELIADPERLPAFTQTKDQQNNRKETKARVEKKSPGAWDEMQRIKQEMLEEMGRANPECDRGIRKTRF